MTSMTQNTQKAAFLDAQSNGKLYVGDKIIPSPGPGELLVKVMSAGLNPVDWKIPRRGMALKEYPAVLGSDIAGEVIDVGPSGDEPSGFVKGDRVFCQGMYVNDKAGFQQFTITGVHTTAKIPEKTSYDEACTIPVALTAAYVALYNKPPYGIEAALPLASSISGAMSNSPIVILGGSSSVGQFAIQLARASGFSPIITTSSLKHSSFLKTLGATDVVDRTLPTQILAETIPNLTGVTSFRHIFDAISSAETQRLGYNLLSQGGRLAIVQPRNNDLQEEPDSGKTIVPVYGAYYLPAHANLLRDMYGKLTEWLQQGILKPNRVSVLPGGLEGIISGLKKLENDEVSGTKLVGHPQETT